MPALLHEAHVRDSIRRRVEALKPDATRRWGKMTVDQMLWHCNQVLGTALGDVKVEPRRPPFPVPMLEFILFNLPWPHGRTAAAEYTAVDPGGHEDERRQCRELIERFTARGLD